MSQVEDQDFVVVERKRGGFGAFIWGALIGAGLALLLAPRSGRQLRAGIKDGVRRLRDQAEDAVRDAQRSVTERYDDVRGDLRERMEAAREAFEAGRRAARETVRSGSQPSGRFERPDVPPREQETAEELDADM